MLALPPTLYSVFLLLAAAEAGAAQPAATCPPPFVVGAPVERSLGGGRDEIIFDLEAARYVRLKLDQSEGDLRLTLLNPAQRVIARIDGSWEQHGPELISWVTGEAGTYRLLVETGVGPSRYKVTCEEHRLARPDDSLRVAGEFALWSAMQLREADKDLERALAYAEEARCLWRRIGDQPHMVEALLETGFIHQVLGQRQEAAGWFEESLAAALAGDDQRGQVRALRSLGGVRTQDDPVLGLRYASEALFLARNLDDAGLMASLLEVIGFGHFQQGLNQQALASFQEALPLAAAVGDHNTEASLWNHMGAVYSRMGEGGQALKCHERALEIAGTNGNLVTQAVALTSIGLQRVRRGELQLALVAFSEALTVNDRLGSRSGEATVRNHLASLFLDMGEPEKALSEYSKALSIHRLGQDASWEAITRIGIGEAYHNLDRNQQALEQFEEALNLTRPGGNIRTSAAALHGQGLARRRLGSLDAARDTLYRALDMWRKSGDRRGEAVTLLEIGTTHRLLKQHDKVVPTLEAALALAREIEAWFVQTAALHGLAVAARDRGDLKTAREHIEEAIKILNSVRSTLPGDRLRSSFVASKRFFYDFYVDVLMRLGETSLAFEASEAARARSLLDLLAEGRGEVTKGISAELKGQEHEIAARLAATQLDLSEALARTTPDQARIRALHERLAAVEEERQKLELRIRLEHPRYAEIRYSKALGLTEIQSGLGAETALIEYWLGGEGCYVFVVTREGLLARSLPGKTAITEQVQRARAGLQTIDRNAFYGYLGAARWLYDELVAPLRPALAGKRHLVIAADAALHYLAFETLLTDSRGGRDAASLPYLVREFAVSYTPSATVLSQLGSGREPAPGLSFVAFADPAYNRTASPPMPPPGGARAPPSPLSTFPRLEGSKREVEAIAKLYSDASVRLFLREEANERNVASRLTATAARLHFAAHGVLNEEWPELSGLALTPTEQPGDDGLLQVFEILNLDLGADLVVLSACETGLGKEVKGEGLVGLVRAFLYAGAPSVVVSLWRVRDDAAPDLMIRFYGALELADSAEALRQSKLAMIEGGDHAQPYYWAPFILVGKAR